MPITYKTKITDLYDTKLPIIAGGLMWLSNAQYVAAAARAGIMGFITAASFPNEQDLRNEIRKCKDLSEGKNFGVNVSMLPKLVPGDKTEDVFKLIIDEGVKFVETSGRSPEAYIPMLKDAGIKILHKVPSIRFAIKAQSLGVDAVSIVGAECGGHPGMEMIGTMVNSAWAQEQLHIPYVIGGGIGNGSQILAALAMGADGVVIGTRFLVADEIWAHNDYKQKLIEAKASETVLTMHSVKNTVRTLRNETTDLVQAMEDENPNITIQDLMPLVSGKISHNAYTTGDWRKGMLSAGQALAFVDKTQPLQEIITRLELQLAQATKRLNDLQKTSQFK